MMASSETDRHWKLVLCQQRSDPIIRIAFSLCYFASLMMGVTAFLSVAAEWHPLRLAQPAQALWT